MPVISFTLIGIGGLFVYSGYLGYSPAQLTKAILDGKLATLKKIPIDPRKRTGSTTPSTPGSPSTPSTPGSPSTPKTTDPTVPWWASGIG